MPGLTPAWTIDTRDHPAAVGWSADGELLAIGCGDGAVVVVAAGAGVVAGRIALHAAPVSALRWSPVASVLATAGQDGAVRLADPHGGVRTVVEPGPVWTDHVVWHPRGKRLAVARGKEVLVIDPALAGASPLVVGPLPSTVTGVAWSPDGRQLAASAYGGLRLFDPVTGALTRTLAWRGSMLGVAWRRDGKVLAGGSQDRSVHFWRLPSGDDSEMSGYVAKPKDVVWSPDGAWLATSGGPTISVWPFDRRGPEGRAPVDLEGHEELVTALAYTPLTSILLSGDRAGRLCQWAAPEERRPVGVHQLPGRITAVAWGAAPQVGTVRWAAASTGGLVAGGAM